MKRFDFKSIHFIAAVMIVSAAFILPVFAAHPDIVSAAKLIPIGRTTGIKLYSEGPVIIGFSSDEDSSAKNCGLSVGDVIISFDGVKTSNVRELSEAVGKCRSEIADICVLRRGAEKHFDLRPYNKNGEICIGVMLRDTIAGIGTITFIDPETGKYGALGHSICDPDTSSGEQYDKGTLMPSRVLSVKRGKDGIPGEIIGSFDNSFDSGTVTLNTESGIYGKIKALPGSGNTRLYDTASINEIRPGKATIISNVNGTETNEYEIEILSVFKDEGNNRQMLIKVTDEKLLRITGGIVQGMSGSPVIQNGKLIGAVTHVLINDPAKGYAIGIDEMLDDLKAA
ncbi:MAG: SpoIVB peptidase [Clostridia bacterium]|nr:SpoIVB peptidase [Clostridia bacterium]